MRHVDRSHASEGRRASRYPQHLVRRAVLLPALALSAACAGIEPPSSGTATASVAALIGDGACDNDAQCHTIGVGAKACGGPQAYLAWSSKRSDRAALEQAAEREARAARAAAEASGIMSNCALVKDPGAFCAPAGAADAAMATNAPRRCRLRAVGPGGAGAIY